MAPITFSRYITNYSSLTLVIILCLTLSKSQAQSPIVDSLRQAAYSEKKDTTRVNIYNEISWQLRTLLPTSAHLYADSAISVSKKTDYWEGLSTAYNRKGVIEKGQGHFIAAKFYYDSALVIEKQLNNQYGIGRASNQLASIYRSLGNFDKALEFSKISVEVYKKIGPKRNLGIAYGVLGNIFNNLTQYDSSLFYLNKSLETYAADNYQPGIAESYLNLANLYERMRNYTRCIEVAERSVEIYKAISRTPQLAKALNVLGNGYFKTNRLQEAEIVYNQSLSISTELGLNQQLASVYGNLANISEMKGNIDLAIEQQQRSLNLYQSMQDARQYIPLTSLGNLTTKKGDNQKSIEYFRQAYDHLERTNSFKNNPEVIRALANAYSKIGNDTEAIKFFNRYAQVTDEIQRDLIKVGNLERELRDEKNLKKLLEKEVDNQRLTSSRQRLIIMSLTIGCLLLVLIFFITFRIYKLKNDNIIREQNEQLRIKEIEKLKIDREISAKNESLQKKKIEQLIKQREIDAMNAMMEGQEKERTRIARDLHDRLGGMLSVVKFNFKSVEDQLKSLKEDNLKQYEEANNLLNQACDEVRKIANDMASGILVKFGLAAALKDLKSTIDNTGQLKMNLYDIGLEERLDYDYEINVYRIIQELVTNTLKHAEATEFNVQIFKKEDYLNIVVEDNGKGFDSNKALDKKDSMGLKNIEARIEKFDGTMNIDSGLGAGSTFTFDIPIKYKVL